MTPQQFDALARLLQFKDSAAREAARLVLVEGLTKAEAARRTGISAAASGQAVRSMTDGLELARVAVGG